MQKPGARGDRRSSGPDKMQLRFASLEESRPGGFGEELSKDAIGRVAERGRKRGELDYYRMQKTAQEATRTEARSTDGCETWQQNKGDTSATQ